MVEAAAREEEPENDAKRDAALWNAKNALTWSMSTDLRFPPPPPLVSVIMMSEGMEFMALQTFGHGRFHGHAYCIFEKASNSLYRSTKPLSLGGSLLHCHSVIPLIRTGQRRPGRLKRQVSIVGLRQQSVRWPEVLPRSPLGAIVSFMQTLDVPLSCRDGLAQRLGPGRTFIAASACLSIC